MLNLFDPDDVSAYSDFVSDPKVIIEWRSLRYWEPDDYDPNDPDSEEEPELRLTFEFSKYDTIVNEDAYYTKIRIFRTFGTNSNAGKEYIRFIEDPDHIIICNNEILMGGGLYAVVEYIDRRYSTKGVGYGIEVAAEPGITFESGLGYIPDVEFIEED